MDLINEKNVVLFQIGEQGGQVLGLFQHRPAGLPQVHPQLGRNDVAERSLAQPGRAEQEHMVQRLAPLAGRTDEDLQLLPRLGLPNVLLQQLGTQRPLQRLFLRRDGGGGDHALGGGGSEVVGLDGHSGRLARTVEDC